MVLKRKISSVKKDSSDVEKYKYKQCKKIYKILSDSNLKYVEKYNYIIRKKMYDIVSTILPTNIEKSICLNDLIEDDILLDITYPIAEGSFGKVSLVYLKCTDFVIAHKDAKLISEDFVKMKKGILEEVAVLSVITKNILNHTIYNFPIMYSASYCEKSRSKEVLRNYNIFMEKYDGTLRDVFYNDPPDILLENILLQCTLAVASAQHLFGLYHTDIKSINFLYKSIIPGGYWKYIFRGDTYYVENLGIIAILNDFGLCNFTRPKYAIKREYDIKEYGNRSIEIVDGKIDIIKYKYHLKYNKKYVPCKEEGHRISLSIANNKFNLHPDREIDLEDFDRFPPLEFMYDNIDLLRMFCGGPRTLQRGNHSGSGILRRPFLKKLSDISLNLFDTSKRKDVEYIFSGKILLRTLFPDIKKCRGKPLDIFSID